jgi:hypothetical protein
MSNPTKFDPYLSWLGIRDPERPPNHYRLLGLEVFESDSNVIASAADRQMAHVRTHQAGTHGEDSQRLLNELMSAKICLLKSERKAEYDKALRAKIAASKSKETNGPNQENLSPFAPAKGTSNSSSATQASDFTDASQIFGTPRTDSKVANRRTSTPIRSIQKPKPYAMYGVIAGLVLIAIVVTIALANSDNSSPDTDQPKSIANNTQKPNIVKPPPVEPAPTPPTATAVPVVKPTPTTQEVEPRPKPHIPPPMQDPGPNIATKQNETEKSPFDDDNPQPRDTTSPNEKQPKVAMIEPKIEPPQPPKENPEDLKAKAAAEKNRSLQIEAARRRTQIARGALPGVRQPPGVNNGGNAVPENRHPVPKLDAVAERRKKIRTNYKDDYSRRDNPKILESLATKLIDLGNDAKDDLPAMYAFFDEARTIASSISDIRLMINAMNKLVENFDINPNKELVTTIGMISNFGDVKPEAVVQLYIYCSDRLVKMLDNDELDFAEPLLKAVIAINGRNVPVYRTRGESVLKDYQAEINDIKRNLTRIKKARETLAQNPEDAAANTEIGRYLFFERGRQMDAIPYLAKGTEGDLQKLAEEELSVGADPTEVFTLAEKWWQSSLEKGNSEARAQIKIHSCLLASGVLNQLKSLEKSEVESHLLDLEKDKFVVASDRSVQKIMMDLLTRGTYRVTWSPNDSGGTMMTFLPNGKMNGDFINWEFARYWGGVVCWNHFQNGDRSVFESRYLVSHSLITVSARGITIRRFNDLGKPERLGTGVLAAK